MYRSDSGVNLCKTLNPEVPQSSQLQLGSPGIALGKAKNGEKEGGALPIMCCWVKALHMYGPLGL